LADPLSSVEFTAQLRAVSPLRPRVLLLERHAGLRQLFEEALGELGFEVVPTEERGQALVALLAGVSVDLFVVDLVDRAAGGEGFVALLANEEVTARTPVIVMTDDERVVVPERALRLVKPFGLDELSFAVREAMSAKLVRGGPERLHHTPP
jgi:DNA-binding response OmpR family regulator